LGGGRLIEALRLTPFARDEFDDAIDPTDDPIEWARRLIVRSFMGFGSNAHSGSDVAKKTGGTRARPRNGAGNYRSTGFRANSNRSGTTAAHDWSNYPDCLPPLIDRLRGVVIENRDAREVMSQHDSEATLHYVDPPYLPETRSPANKYDLKHRMYRHELTRDDHVALLEFLRSLEGMVVLSGYPSPLYDEALTDWQRHETETHADGARDRTEVLWLNPACVANLERDRLPLLSAMGASA
jgi:DNA adenine methylase